MEEIYNCRNENLICNNNKFKFRMKIVNSNEIKELFEEYVVNLKFYDDESINTKKRREMIKKLIDDKNKKALLDLIKNGIPNCMRREIYLFLLNSFDDKEVYHTNKIYNSIIDYIIISDIQVIFI